MAEQLVRLTGHVKQANNAEFFLIDSKDIDASKIMQIDSNFENSSLYHFFEFNNIDTTSKDYDLYIDVNNIVIEFI